MQAVAMQVLAPLFLVLVLLAAPSARAADGKALYDANCAKCHGADGKAETPVGKAMKVPSLVSARWAEAGAADAIVAHLRGSAKHEALVEKLGEDLAAVAGAVQALAAGGQH